MRSRAIRSSVAITICLGAAACHSGKDSPPQPSKEVAKLGQLVGKWSSKSHHLAQDLRGGAPDRDLVFTCLWTKDRNYVACSQVGEIAGKEVKEVDVYGYSEQARLYTMIVFVDVADSPPQVFSNWFEWDGSLWRFLPRDGIRATWEFTSPDHHVTRAERLVDGKRWELTAIGEHTRVY
jgi:hypothetical protein